MIRLQDPGGPIEWGSFRAAPRPYRHPADYRPPLAWGGHEFVVHGHSYTFATCIACGATVPLWAIKEGFWPSFMQRWCIGKIRALGAA